VIRGFTVTGLPPYLVQKHLARWERPPSESQDTAQGGVKGSASQRVGTTCIDVLNDFRTENGSEFGIDCCVCSEFARQWTQLIPYTLRRTPCTLSPKLFTLHPQTKTLSGAY